MEKVLSPNESPSTSLDPKKDLEEVQELHTIYRQIHAELHKRIVGQDHVIESLLVALFSRGHTLIVGVPGLAKTLLIATLAEILDLAFNRIQFTPDLMPSDITGTEILEEDHSTGKRGFHFVRGPIFCNLLLADEINRTPPKTQAALLQSMQEYRVTAGGKTHSLDLPFLVMATQNPIEQEGTYPLPEAQLDRFMLQIRIGYPSATEEEEIVRSTTSDYKPNVQKFLNADKIRSLQDLVRRVPVPDHATRAAVRLVRSTRPDAEEAHPFAKQYLTWGAGPRASQNLILGAKARAILQGRYSVEVEDVRALAKEVLSHRILTNYEAESEEIRPEDIIDTLLKAHT